MTKGALTKTVTFWYPTALVERGLIKGTVGDMDPDGCYVAQQFVDLLGSRQLLAVCDAPDAIIRATRVAIGHRLDRWDQFAVDAAE